MNYHEFDLEGDTHNTTLTCLKRVGHGGYEWEEKEMRQMNFGDGFLKPINQFAY